MGPVLVLAAGLLSTGLTTGLVCSVPVHGGPPAFLEARVKPGAVELVLTGEQILLGEWFRVPGRTPLPLGEDVRGNLLEGARDVLDEILTVRLGGELVEPELTGLRAFPATTGAFGLEPSYELRMRVPIEVAPETVDVHWLRFPPPPTEAEVNADGPLKQRQITLHITSLEGVFDLQNLTLDEPQYTWHRPPAPLPIELLPVGLGMQPERDEGLLLALPFGLLGLALLAWLGRRFWRALPAGSARVGALALWFAGGTVLFVQWRRAYLVEPGPPDEASALELFEQLHTNMYRAFEGGGRGEVYDLLATSVDGPILDAMYGDIYESLILREDGGAVAQVQSVEVLGRELDEALTEQLGGAGFGVVWDWRVRGRVVHFAHEHQRAERLRARYSVLPTAAGWRIAGVEVLEQEREQ